MISSSYDKNRNHWSISSTLFCPYKQKHLFKLNSLQNGHACSLFEIHIIKNPPPHGLKCNNILFDGKFKKLPNAVVY